MTWYRSMSLRSRLLAGIGVVVILLVLVAALVTSLTRRHLIDQIDTRLDTVVQSGELLLPIAWDDAEGSCTVAAVATETVEASDDNRPPPRWSEFFIGYFRDGELRAGVRPNTGENDTTCPDVDATQAADVVGTTDPFTVPSMTPGGPRWRVVAVEAQQRRTGETTTLVVGLPLDEVSDAVRRLVVIEALATGAVIAVLGAVAWWVIRLGVQPVKRMTTTASAIAAGDLNQRVPEFPAGSEAGDLGRALNHMLGELQTSLDERTASQERLQQFVADASHELRTPVTTIRGYAELYRIGGLGDGEPLDEAMRRTEQEAVRMSRLIDDMLTIAKLGEGRQLERQPVDLARLVADAAADAGAVAPDRTITVDAPAPVLVTGDEDRLRQVVANVVANALVHTPAGSAIELQASAAAGRGLVSVTDHGAGMTDAVAAKVTERFYRADPARARDRGGSGLGMAIVDAAVAAHGGTVIVRSEVGVGTTVSVELPLAASLPPPQPD